MKEREHIYVSAFAYFKNNRSTRLFKWLYRVSKGDRVEWAKNLSRHSSKEDTQMANKHMENVFCYPQPSRKCKPKTTMRYHFTTCRMTTIKIHITPSVGKDVGKPEHSYIAEGKVKYCNHFRKESAKSSKG